jgi:uncharacterized protein
MATEKDRLGDTLHDAEKGREEEYFARRDRELLGKLKQGEEQQFQDELKAAEKLICPRCGKRMDQRVAYGVTVDVCPNCEGVWLDKGELEALAKADEQRWFARLFGRRK